MKKYVIFLSLLLIFISVFSQQKKNTKVPPKSAIVNKKCDVSGIVRYYFNKYQGYKPDVGSNVYIVKQKDLDSVFNYTLFNEYVALSSSAMSYYSFLREMSEYKIDKSTKLRIRDVTNFSDEAEMRFNQVVDSLGAVGFKIAMKRDEIKKKYDFESFVDASSSYKIQVPYGSYYIIIRSNNRQRDFVPEFTGRLYINKVELNTPKYICSIDFDM